MLFMCFRTNNQTNWKTLDFDDDDNDLLEFTNSKLPNAAENWRPDEICII